MIIRAGSTPNIPITGGNPFANTLRSGGHADTAPRRAHAPVGPLAPNDAERLTQAFDNVVSQLNQQMQLNNRNLGFTLDRRLNTPVITVTDKNTGDLVRQIPAESVLRVAHSIENLKGVLYNSLA